uniref:Uncharacterized protein n=1 Tax=Arundo donax TaxID=35708 RepID=A0A0A8YBT2_ARUDO
MFSFFFVSCIIKCLLFCLSLFC